MMVPSCFFLPCFTSSGRFELTDDNNSDVITTTIISKHKKKKSNPAHFIDSSSGAMRIPTYHTVSRDNCSLLRLAWEQQWQKVAIRCVSHPHEAFCRTENSLRTPLHLGTLNNVPCPIEVAQALLQANRHMILMEDKDRYTPLHNICFFRPSSSSSSNRRRTNRLRKTKLSVNGQVSTFYDYCSRLVGEIEDNELIPLFCDTSIMVEQELQGYGRLPESMGVSPLFLAAKRNAPLSTIQILLQTRKQGYAAVSSISSSSLPQQHQPQRRARWIAPSTGGEPYWCSTTLEDYSSPLEILLRERASKVFGFLWNESSEKETSETTTTTTSPVDDNPIRHKEERERLVRILREVACARLGGLTHKASNSSTTSEQESTNQSTKWQEDLQQISVRESHAVLLWEKCIELLVEHCPRLQRPEQNVRQNGNSVVLKGLVHTVACLKVPIPILLRLTLHVFPEQTLLRDEERGMTPLHHVLEAQHPYATKTLLSIILEQEPTAAFDSFPETPSSLFVPNSTLRVTLKHDNKNSSENDSCNNSNADEEPSNSEVSCDHQDGYSNLSSWNHLRGGGPSPVIRALELNLPFDLVQNLLVLATNRNSDENNENNKISDQHCHDDISCHNDDKSHHSYPNPLEVADPTTGLYPFAVAACQGYDLTVIYVFLLANPQVLFYQQQRPSLSNL